MRKFLLTTTALLSLAAAATQARAYETITPLSQGLGGTDTLFFTITPDGAFAGGYSFEAGDTVNKPIIYDIENDTILDLGSLGGTGGSVYGLSADGSVAVGESNLVGDASTNAFRWVGGVMTNLGTLGGTYSNAFSISADGLVVHGTAFDGGGIARIFRWEGGVMTAIPDFDPNNPSTLSRDGSTVLGHFDVGGFTRAHIWNGGVTTALGTLGGNLSTGNAISYDGSVVVGTSSIAGGDSYAFRWEGGVMQNLGTLGGDQSTAEFVTPDGTVVLGVSATVGVVDSHAFRWEGGTMTALGNFGGTSSNIASFNSDATRIIGVSTDAGDVNYIYYFWDTVDGFQALESKLLGDGVDLNNWDTSTFYDIRMSADGDVLIGTANYLGSATRFIISGSGITTPEDLTETLIPVAQTRQQTVSGLTVGTQQSLFASRQAFSGFRGDFFMPDPSPENLASLAPAAGGHTFDSPALASRYSAYVTGAIGVGASNNSANTAGYGTTGLFARISDEWAVGLGVITGSSFTQLKYGGEGRLTGFGGALNIAHESADSGWRIYGTATVQSLNLDMDRNYINGSGIDGSTGETDGIGFAGAVQLGYALPVSQAVSLMPYASIDASRTRMDSYSETGGAFPATFSKQTATVINGHLGVEASYQAASNFTLKGRTAWGHQLESRSNSATATALSITYTLPYEDGAPNWVETGITANWQVSDRLNMTTDLAGRFGNTGEPAASVTVGLSYGF
jgi:probable HAF family extracellular repeat protein